ncbi:hypothetical protein [Telmatospirillum siberiense]|uniref:Uncharacterized protein n=1 Tax=Telmatospirillum siberiense TaxID=382514 RepID=A0A2N3PTL2_9PROT|nr:hypothetical protein [Telmatospirillum siberiense]PKU23742.1 hypothetical protein CWS72_14690 [Telmatospirillum siberiense]
MLLGDIVNVFIGLALTYATLSLVVSAITEAIASIFKWRANTLLAGLKTLLNDPNLTGLARDILNHAAINPRGSGTDVTTATSYALRPSYIPAPQFAAALIDVIQRPPTNPTVNLTLKAAIAGIPDAQLRSLLQGFYERTGGDLESFHAHLATWFDAAMDRLSGDYKRQIQLVSFLIGLAITAALNANTFDITRAFWLQPTLVEQIHMVTPGTPAPQALHDLLNTNFPFGWPKDIFDTLRYKPFDTVFGLLMTAISLLFGAPFWFDLLQRFVQLRGTGPVPDAAITPTPRPQTGSAS